MPTKYKTIFIDTSDAKVGSMMRSITKKINGDELARDVQAALIEAESQGFKLIQMSPVTSSLSNNRTYTEGMLLVFEQKN